MPTETLTDGDRQVLAEVKTHFAEQIKTQIEPLKRELEDTKIFLQNVAQRTSKGPGFTSGTEPAFDGRASLGARFIATAGFREWCPKHAGATPQSANYKAHLGPLETKATIFTSGGLVAPVRLPGIAPFPVPPANFVDAIPWRLIDGGNEVQYLRQTSLPAPGAKTQVAEGDTKSEQSVAVALQTEPILTIACWTSASTQALLDLAMLQVFLDQVLLVAVRQEIDRQALVGLGPAAELKGILSIATPLAGAPPAGSTAIDVVSAAIAQLAAIGVTADIVVLNSLDAAGIRTIKTSFGTYVLGDPSSTSATPSLWGLKVVVDANMPLGSFLVGQSSAAAILDRQESAIMISYEHADYFTRNLVAIRAEARVGQAVFIPGAWVTGTLPAGSTMATQGTFAGPAPVGKK